MKPVPDDLSSQFWGGASKSGPQSLGQLIRYYRERKHLSQEELGNLLIPKVDQSRVSKWEQDQSVPRKERLIQLAKLYGIAATELMDAQRFTHGGKSFSFDRRYLDAYDDVARLGDGEILNLFVRLVQGIAALLKLVLRKYGKTP